MGSRSDRKDRGHLAVVEAMIVGFIVIGGVAAVTLTQGLSAPAPSARPRLQSATTDAISLLGELPPDDSRYESALEEAVTLAVQGDRSLLTERLDRYFPPGVHYEVYLENGRGGLYPVYSLGEEPSVETVTASTILSPHWSALHARPVVEQVSGVVPLSLLGAPTGPISNTLSVRGALVRNSYIDSSSDVTLGFPNGHSASFPVRNAEGMRWTDALAPEYRSATGTVSGFDVPYTLASWPAYQAATLDLTQPVAAYHVLHDLTLPQSSSALYEVHPKFTLSSAISTALLGLPAAKTWKHGAATPDYALGDDVTFTWDFSGLAAIVLGDERTITIYNPAGGAEIVDTSEDDVLAGTYAWSIPRDSLWGSYVAELTITARDPLNIGRVYVIYQLTYVNVNPPNGFTFDSNHIPPIYRVVLNAWFGEWDQGGGDPDACASCPEARPSLSRSRRVV